MSEAVAIATGPAASQGFTSVFVTAQDGLKLHVRVYGGSGRGRGVLCLPALAHTGADFDALASALATDAEAPRRVAALDYRGCGRSEYDRDPRKYAVPVEVEDVSTVLTALGLAPCVVIGTSRGGILTMFLAALRPTAIAGAILNDVGPVLDPRGVLRMRAHVGKLPLPRSFEDGARILRRQFEPHFPKLTQAEWIAFARRTWRLRGRRLALDYDPKLARTLEDLDIARIPELWDQFDALAGIPLMVIRGLNSDMLAPATLDAMLARRTTSEVAMVPDQGHAPLLTEHKLLRRIAAFVASCDAPTPPSEQVASL